MQAVRPLRSDTADEVGTEPARAADLKSKGKKVSES